MSTTRNPCDVIDQVLVVVPPTETELRTCLTKLKESAPYVPPEMLRGVWMAIGVILNGALPWPPKEEWQKRVHAIVKGRVPTGIAPSG